MNLNYKKDCEKGKIVRYARNSDDDKKDWRVGEILLCLENNDEHKENGCKCRFTDGSIGYSKETFESDEGITDEIIDDLIKKDEFLMAEFKETFCTDSSTGEEKKCLRDAVVKNVAGMMNNRGGYVVIGLKENGTEIIVSGLEPDFKIISQRIERATQSVEDKFMIEVGQYIKSKLNFPLLEKSYVINPIKEYKGKQICIITVKKSEIPALIDEDVQILDCATGEWKKSKKKQVYYVKESSTSASQHDIREVFSGNAF